MIDINIIIPIFVVVIIFITVLWVLLIQNKTVSKNIESEKNKFSPYKEKLKRLNAEPKEFEKFNGLVRDFLKERFKMEYSLTYLEIAENFKKNTGDEGKHHDQEEWDYNLEEITRLLKYGKKELMFPGKNKEEEIAYAKICLEEAYRRLKNMLNKIPITFLKQDKEKFRKFLNEIQEWDKDITNNNPYDLLEIVEKGLKILKEIKTPGEMINFCDLMNRLIYSGERTNLNIKKAMELFYIILTKYG
jgi:hypothetical protein